MKSKSQKQLEEEIKELENKTEIEFRGVLGRKYPTPKYPITFCEDLKKLHIAEALLAQKIEDKKKMMEIIEKKKYWYMQCVNCGRRTPHIVLDMKKLKNSVEEI